jgi:hypothetical protein
LAISAGARVAALKNVDFPQFGFPAMASVIIENSYRTVRLRVVLGYPPFISFFPRRSDPGRSVAAPIIGTGDSIRSNDNMTAWAS